MKTRPGIGYYWPRVWLSSQPSGDADTFEMSSLRDLVCDREVTQGLRVKAFRSGLFVFDFSDWVKEQKESKDKDEPEAEVARKMWCVRVFNAHLMCLYDAVFRRTKKSLPKMVLHHDEVVWVGDFADPLTQVGGEIWAPIDDILVSNRTGADKLLDVHSRGKLQKTFSARHIVSDEALADSFDLLATILNHPSEYCPLLVEILAHSCKAIEEHNYDLALITAWSVVEKLLGARWADYIDGQRTLEVQMGDEKVPLMNADRAKRLRSGRDYTASVITEFLTCLGKLPFDLYANLNKVRQARNDWTHSLKPPTFQVADNAIGLALDMMREVEHLDLQVGLALYLIRAP